LRPFDTTSIGEPKSGNAGSKHWETKSLEEPRPVALDRRTTT
jgi:hypothetical protein